MQVSDDPRVGTELAGYRIESLLGLGGMSVVYLAEDLRLKRRVALKLLAAGLAEDESFRDRFLRESELAASIDHPNIVPIYEAGTNEDVLFIGMRFVEGRDLKERLRRGPLDPADAVGVVAQVASALDAAHARGLVHRDVKPSNVLLDVGARPDGSDHVYLADFGITKRTSDDPGFGEEAHLLGTIDYVAPEQIAGGEVDGRADVYSLGCVLYECLVGRPPFQADSELAVVFAHLESEPPAPSAERPDLPAGLDGVIARALAKEPADRYASCRALASAALAVAVDEASRLVVDVASRAAAGRSELSEVEAELAGKVSELQLAHERERALSLPVARPDAQQTCPFKGLASFDTGDADFFFGRERLVAELAARLVGTGFLGIVGPSGTGKSSVLRAGLLPALAGGVLPGSQGWRRWLLRPGEHPMDELATVLASGAEDPLAATLDALSPGERLLLTVDQLEELFTACRSDTERAAFTAMLTRAATDPEGRALVVVALRADFYGRFAAYPQLAELLGANHVLVGPMQASELRRAVELPAARVGVRVEPGLTDSLVGDVEGEPGALPLLSTALLELWHKRGDNALTLAAYRESGGVDGAVARLAEATYARVPDSRKPLVRTIMLRLVGSDEGDVPVRRRAALGEFDAGRDEVRDVLTTLADSRLVIIDEGSIEVAHEALLREWPRLREWIEEDTEGRRLHRQITHAASEWNGGGRDPDELYRGARLAAALDWSADHAPELNELEREFVSKSRDASEHEATRARRANRRLRALLAGVAVLLLAALAGGILALVQRGEARDAETAQVAQRLGAQALADEDLDRSLLLARQAVAIADTPQTRGSLLSALLRSPKAIGIMHGPDDASPVGIALSPDGTTIVVSDFFKKLLFFDARTYRRVGEPLRLTEWVEGLAYSPDGETIAFGGDFYLSLIDARTRKTLEEAPLNGHASRMAFTRDGSKLVVLTVEPFTISIRDATTLDPVGPAIEPSGFSPSSITSFDQPPHFALTPDGRSVVTASDQGELTWWDLRSGRKTRTLEIASGYHALALGPDGLKVAVGIEGGIQLVDTRTGETETRTADLAGHPESLLFSHDGRTLVSTNDDGTVTVWDAGSATPRETLRGHSASRAVFSRDGETLYTVSGDGTAIAWDLTGARRLGRPFMLTRDRPLDEMSDAYPGRFSPDGRLIAVGLKNGGIAFRDAQTFMPSGAPLRETGGEVQALAFSPDGATLAGVSSSGMTTLWDVSSRSLRHEPFYAGLDASIAFSPDGKTLATSGSGGGVAFWDVETGESSGRIGGFGRSRDVAFSADGERVAFAEDGSGFPRAQVWDVAKRSRIAEVSGGDEGDAQAVALSPDGRIVAVGGYGRAVRLWDVRTGKLLHALDGGGAQALEFSRDGRILAVSNARASLWDVQTGVQIGPTLTAGNQTAAMDLSSDGRRLLITSSDGTGAVWDTDPESWARRACALANRTLTRDEWERFLPGRRYEPACAN